MTRASSSKRAHGDGLACMNGWHPAIQTWFKKRYGQPNALQQYAWPKLRASKDLLLLAPTGSGKTLTAFMLSLQRLFEQGLQGRLERQTQIVYVAPMKALTADIQWNVNEAIEGINQVLMEQGEQAIAVESHLRNGDTPAHIRARFSKRPAHLLMTTPESFYLLLSSQSGRCALATVQTLIVDEIHAFLGNKRGAHMALSMQRFAMLQGRRCQRIGLTATVADPHQAKHFLVGTAADCEVLEMDYKRRLDIRCETPALPLGAFMTHELRLSLIERLSQLVEAHGCTLIFVRSRREAERTHKLLSDRLPSLSLATLHSSMSVTERKRVLRQLQRGELNAVVATAALELGVDLGAIDLVCQVGSPKKIVDFRQRLGRCGRSPDATSKCRIFATTREELLECYALVSAVAESRLDQAPIRAPALDVLAQQIVAEIGCGAQGMSDLYEQFKQASCYETLAYRDYEELVRMLAQGYPLNNGGHKSLIHYDQVNQVLRPRRNTRLTALLNGGTIPDQFDYQVILMPEKLRVGTLNEDFAIESMVGSVFQLGNRVYRILSIRSGELWVVDAQTDTPNIPFWLGEGPARSDGLSELVAKAREDAQWGCWSIPAANDPQHPAAVQLLGYRQDIRDSLGVIPTNQTIVMERFFDDSGDQHLVIHSCLGARINRAWGLALRKCFCRRFNFELQAAALDNCIIISLGTIHSFELDEVKRWLSSRSVARILTQAVLDTEIFKLRWRWAATNALAIPRVLKGHRFPPYLSRIYAENLLAVLFPDQLKCLENITGDREVPDHPLVRQVLDDCLQEYMDLAGLIQVLGDIEAGTRQVRCVETDQPSVIAAEILHAAPYAFLDNAPLEERRTQAAQSQPAAPLVHGNLQGHLEPTAVAWVSKQLHLCARDEEELHDALLRRKVLAKQMIDSHPRGERWLAQLQRQGRAFVFWRGSAQWVVATEHFTLFKTALAETWNQSLAATQAAKLAHQHAASLSQEQAVAEVLLGYMPYQAPVTAEQLAQRFQLPLQCVEQALRTIQNMGQVFSGHYHNPQQTHWCDRAVLYRISRHTRDMRRRKTLVSTERYVQFLTEWLSLGRSKRGPYALEQVLKSLEGFAVPYSKLESELLTQRVADYQPAMLDHLLLSGQYCWFAALSGRKGAVSDYPTQYLALRLVQRSHWKYWCVDDEALELTAAAMRVYEILQQRGSAFLEELQEQSGMLMPSLQRVLSQLVAKGCVSSDSYAGARWLSAERSAHQRKPRSRSRRPLLPLATGRWYAFKRGLGVDQAERVHYFARLLLRRYGVVCRRWLSRERIPAVSWSEMLTELRRMEARDEIAGGRFISCLEGEQFAHKQALIHLDNAAELHDAPLMVCATDPVNLTGLLSQERVAARPGHYLLLHQGRYVAAMEAGECRALEPGGQDGVTRMKQMLEDRKRSTRARIIQQRHG